MKSFQIVLFLTFFTAFLFAAPANNPTIFIEPVSQAVNEGNSSTTTISFKIKADFNPNKKPITIDYTTVDGTATAGSDYIFASGSVVFDTTGTLDYTKTVTVIGDTALEPDQTFYVKLSGASILQQPFSITPDTMTFTIINDDVAGGSDLSIEKRATDTSGNTINAVWIDQAFEYNIDVTNIGPDDTISTTTVTDTLPAGVSIDLAATNSASSPWTCSGSSIVTCTHAGAIPKGGTASIFLKVTAPATYGSITNSATAVNAGDAVISNNASSVTTIVTDGYNHSNPYVCYSTVINYEPATGEPTCYRTGAFYGGVGCRTETTIETNATSPLSGITVIKAYNPSIDSSRLQECGVDNIAGTNCAVNAALSLVDFPSYGGGIEYTLNNLASDQNQTIYDIANFGSGIDDSILIVNYTKDGTDYIGKVQQCAGGSNAAPTTIFYNEGSIDAVDKYALNGHAMGTGLKTRIVQKSYAPDATSDPNRYSLDAVYLGDDNTTAQTYNAADMPVFFYLANEDCSATQRLKDNNGNWLVAVIHKGDIYASTPAFTLNDVDQDARFAMRYLDYQALVTAGGPNCLQHSSTGANAVPGLPSCVASDVQYLDAFHQDAYERCKISHGNPCDPNHHGYGDAPYDNPYGCYECTLGIAPGVCSSDNFAIRPEKFLIDSPSSSFPDLMRSGNNYGLSVKAVGSGTGTPSLNYDQTSANLNISQLTKYYADNTIETNSSMLPGTASWGSSFSITNGQITGGGTAPYAYSDIGRVTIHIADADWSAVDNDDTPQDCSVIGTKICGDSNATFIPDHFRVIVDLNNSSNNFTYLSNEQNMTAHLNVKIYAENEQNMTTQNFTMPAFGHTLYENPMTVKITLPAHPLLGAADKNEVITPALLEFLHGFKALSWNDGNATLALWFHYPRATNLPVNPFVLHGNQVTVDVNSTYVSTSGATEGTPAGTVYIVGSNRADNNVTYLYGRVHLARNRAMCDSAPCSANVSFFYEFYADNEANATLITNLLGGNRHRSIDSVNWYRNTLHNTATDGNVTYTMQNVPGVPTQSSFTHTTQTSSSSYHIQWDKGLSIQKHHYDTSKYNNGCPFVAYL